jgi:cytochrome c oxidase subunit II
MGYNMSANLPLFPEQASTVAGQVDALYFFLVLITVFFTVLVAALVTFFAIKYRRRSETEVPPETVESPLLEITWIVIPLAISLVIFLWGAKVFFTIATPPKETMNIYVTGKQWMWKLQHVNGTREMNELHIPVGRPVKLIMSSEDVIHSFYIPAFRIKGDVMPGNYTKIWFQASKPGTYQLFCAEFCGTRHSNMIGKIVVMEQADFEKWLNNTKVNENTLAAAGSKLFQSLACNSCHNATSGSALRGPDLEGLFGKQVQLQDGSTATVDELYLREAIMNPNARIAQGFPANMPTFKGVIADEQLLELVAYLKTLKKEEKPTNEATGTAKPVAKPATNAVGAPEATKSDAMPPAE